MKEKGFTLIELMIVIAIIGILAIIAVPAYQDHVIRARVTEGLQLASAAKLAVSESALTNNKLPLNQSSTGYISPAATKNVQSVTIGTQGIITISYTEKAGGGTLLLTPILTTNGDMTWECRGGSLAAQYRPADCR